MAIKLLGVQSNKLRTTFHKWLTNMLNVFLNTLMTKKYRYNCKY